MLEVFCSRCELHLGSLDVRNGAARQYALFGINEIDWIKSKYDIR